MTNTVPPLRPQGRGDSLGVPLERLRHRWGWIVAFGAFSTVLGLVALVLTETATIASVLVIGVFMMMAGVVEIGIGLQTRTWGRLLLWEAAGFFYLLAGLVTIAMPIQAAIWLTLLLGAALLATGIVRIVLGLRMSGARSRGAVILAGVVTTLVGLLIVSGWPGNSIIILGTFLGIDLLLYGLTWIMFGYRLHAHR